MHGVSKDVRTCIEQGRLGVAEELCSRLARDGISAAHVPTLLLVAKACDAAGRKSSAAGWLRRLEVAPPAPEHLAGARLALLLRKFQLASSLFGKAAEHSPLESGCLLEMAYATLRTAEQCRQIQRRNGARSVHRQWLERAQSQFEDLVHCPTASMSERAGGWKGLARVLHLKREAKSKIDEALQQASALDNSSLPPPQSSMEVGFVSITNAA